MSDKSKGESQMANENSQNADPILDLPGAVPVPPVPDAFTVAAAKAVLAQADAAEAEASRTRLVEQLKVVRADLHTLRPQLENLRLRVMGLQADEENIARAISVREERISELMATRPECANWLPLDPDVLQWSTALEEKRAELVKLREAGRALPNLYQLRLEGVELATRISTLQYAETNILNRLSGTSGRAWGGKLVTSSVGGVF
jgi:DNA repair exonuclease SbcCD ATPase subunit